MTVYQWLDYQFLHPKLAKKKMQWAIIFRYDAKSSLSYWQAARSNFSRQQSLFIPLISEGQFVWVTIFIGHEFMPICSLVGTVRLNRKKTCEGMKLIFRAQALSFLKSFRGPEPFWPVSFAFLLSHNSDVKKLFLCVQFIPGIVSFKVYIYRK